MTDTATARVPLDLATLALPTKTIVISGEVFVRDEATDPTWAGEWTFPLSGWSEVDRDSWIRMNGTLIGVTREHDELLKAADAFGASPAFLLANVDAEIAAKKRETEIDTRRLEGAKAWVLARKQYGTNVRAIPTVEGDVVITVGMTAKELDAAKADAQVAMDMRLKADPNAHAVAMQEFIATHRNWMLTKCVHPVGADGSRQRIRDIAEMHPTLWDDITAMRNDMARARADDEGKDFAP